MGRFVVQASWSDVPHLTPEMIKAYEAKIPRHQKLARTKGVPHIGSGAIYPIPDDDVTVSPFKIPDTWPRFAGGDCSKTWTAFVWFAWHRDSDTMYIYDEYKRYDVDSTSQHAVSFLAKGKWIPVVADAADIKSIEDRRSYLQIYKDDHGLDMHLPDKAVETGIEQVWERLQGGRLKIFDNCQGILAEKRMYRRDKKGGIVKENDHLLDAARYGVRSGPEWAITKPVKKNEEVDPRPSRTNSRLPWMG